VTSVDCGEAALATLTQASLEQPFELVVLDWKMPGIDGIETAKRISGQLNLHTPMLLMISAYSKDEIVKQAQSAGIEVFLAKPVSVSSLFDTIMMLFHKKSAPAQSVFNRKKMHKWWCDGRFSGKSALLVEDNEINQQLAQEILQDAGIVVTIAANGQQALEKLPEKSFDWVLMDIQMPIMDGFEATARIRKIEQYKDLPIIAMTANAMAEDRQKTLAAGMNAHVNKPIDSQDLFRNLALCIDAELLTNGEIKDGAATGKLSDINPCESENSSESPQVLDQELPSPITLPGLDVATGYDRFVRNKALYLQSLQSFIDKWGTLDRQIEVLLDKGG